MRILELGNTSHFDSEMDSLRRVCFPSDHPNASAKDEFDDRSSHVFARVDGRLAAYGRLIPGPDGYFDKTFRGMAQTPSGADVVDLGRVMVSPEFRGHTFFDLIMLEGLILAAEKGFRYVVGASRPDRKFKPFLHGLGFEDKGPPLPQYFTNGTFENGNQAIVATIEGAYDRWRILKTALLQQFHVAGFELQSSSILRREKTTEAPKVHKAS